MDCPLWRRRGWWLDCKSCDPVGITEGLTQRVYCLHGAGSCWTSLSGLETRRVSARCDLAPETCRRLALDGTVIICVYIRSRQGAASVHPPGKWRRIAIVAFCKTSIRNANVTLSGRSIRDIRLNRLTLLPKHLCLTMLKYTTAVSLLPMRRKSLSNRQRALHTLEHPMPMTEIDRGLSGSSGPGRQQRWS